MNIKITADSTIDLSQEIKQQYGIETIGLIVTLGDNDYIDGETLSINEMLDYTKRTKILPKTGAISVERYREFFAKLTDNDTAIIHFTMSSDMSSCYSFALTASKEFKNVYVVDSRGLSTGIATLAIKARRLADEGVPVEEIYNTVNTLASEEKLQCSFILDNLKFLHKGGRCSAVQRFGANILRLKVRIGIHEGKMQVEGKYRGRLEDCVKTYIKDVLTTYPDYDDYCCFISYTTASEKVLKNAIETVKKYGHFQNIYLTIAGATEASHCGDNTLGILYLKK